MRMNCRIGSAGVHFRIIFYKVARQLCGVAAICYVLSCHSIIERTIPQQICFLMGIIWKLGRQKIYFFLNISILNLKF